MPPRHGEDFVSPIPQRVGRPNEALRMVNPVQRVPRRKVGAKDGIHMKNTGKRIFFAIAALLVVNVGVVVLAGALTSSR